MKVYCRESEVKCEHPIKLYLETPNTEDIWYQEVEDTIELYFDPEYVIQPMKWKPYNVTIEYKGWYDGLYKDTFTVLYSKARERWRAITKIVTYKEGIPIKIEYEE